VRSFSPQTCLSPILLIFCAMDSGAAQDAVDIAIDQIGKPYTWGADGPDEFDCSGLTEFAYNQTGIAIPRQALDQSLFGIAVTGSLRRGDLLFFATDDNLPGTVTHVGIFESGNTMIHAASRAGEVKRADLGHSGTLRHPEHSDLSGTSRQAA